MQPIQTKTYVQGTIYSKTIINTDDSEPEFTIYQDGHFKVYEGKKYKGQEAYASFRTGKEGKFLLNLPPGEYGIVEFDRSESFIAPAIDPENDYFDIECLEHRWATPLVSFKLEISEPVTIDFKVTTFSPEFDPCRKK